MNEMKTGLIIAALAFTMGFFAVFTAGKADSKWVRNTGYAAAVLLWLTAFLFLVPEARPRPCPFLRGRQPPPHHMAVPGGDCPAAPWQNPPPSAGQEYR